MAQKIGILGPIHVAPTADDARRQLLRYQGDWFKGAAAETVGFGALGDLAGATKYAGQNMAKQGLRKALTKGVLLEAGGPATIGGAVAGMLWDYAKNYDLGVHNRLASQSFSRRAGMYNPYDDR